MPTIVVAAVAEELGDLRGYVLGVGPIVAAVNAARLLARVRPTGVALVGTAGVYEGGPAIGSVVAASRVGWAAGSAVSGLGYVPVPPPPLDCDPELLKALDLPAVPVLTTPAITTDRDLARRFAKEWAVEHLEAYGVALACREERVPFVAVFGIANEVGPDAHAQWLLHRDAAQGAARRALSGPSTRGHFLST
jgi:purine-nucleoside phosphorylase